MCIVCKSLNVNYIYNFECDCGEISCMHHVCKEYRCVKCLYTCRDCGINKCKFCSLPHLIDNNM